MDAGFRWLNMSMVLSVLPGMYFMLACYIWTKLTLLSYVIARGMTLHELESIGHLHIAD